VSPSVIAFTSSTTDTPPPTLYLRRLRFDTCECDGHTDRHHCTGSPRRSGTCHDRIDIHDSSNSHSVRYGAGRCSAFSPYLRYLPLWSECPIGSVGFVLALVIAFLLTALGSDRALNAIVLPYFSYLQLAYAIPLILRVTVSRNTFRRGSFHLGRF